MNDTDRAILAFENEHWRYPGNKERAVQEQFGLSLTRYYQRLNQLLDDPEAMRLQPALVKRLQRVRDARARRRSGQARKTA
ncbi:DUF3263 domain-containing protein [Saccharopolyspora rectivirgula]|jgi:hypothetical protein|uniref:DUF3263 domain-containing protein n=1 Tax=Saccharopolyspora rectivirgula TaxID=28042 RepID=A0A073B029_9PSEU|nr:DUF3263 domain-containing protein [Saccharopolyspora rectivirgula]KEI45388.1 hypothetical protein GU90_04590 [Saccharopolyspora rectivirgula]